MASSRQSRTPAEPSPNPVHPEETSLEEEAIMAGKNMKIMFVAENTPATVEMLQNTVTKLDADLFVVDTVEDARSLAAQEQFDVILATAELSDGRGIDLLQAGIAADTPFILIEDSLDAERVLEAMRLGATDIVHPQHTVDQVMSTIDRAVRRGRLCRRDIRRSQRLRRMSSKLIRDRRELRQRVDLICKDLVVAYRRLAEKVVTTPEVGVSAGDGRWETQDTGSGLATE